MTKALPDDPTSLDFTSLLKDNAPKVQPKPATPAVMDEGRVGAQALQREGYHVVIASRARRLAVGAKKHILIVEDDDDTAALATRILERDGYQTLRTASALESSHVMKTLGLPALILLDVDLGPSMNGFDMLARMRAHPKLSTVPVVLCTARSSAEDVIRGLTLGADGYVVKPIASKTLLEVVGKVLGKQ